MQDLMQEQIPVPIKEWSRASVKAQIQINTTKKNVRMHILFCCTNPAGIPGKLNIFEFLKIMHQDIGTIFNSKFRSVKDHMIVIDIAQVFPVCS